MIATKSLAEALALFRSKVGIIPKNATNPFHQSTYADLPSILETINPILEECGLVIFQSPTTTPNGESALRTKIVHIDSGEFEEDIAKLELAKKGPQEQGSAITYMRRYSLASTLQLVIDGDDDGNKASGDPTFHTSYTPNPTTTGNPASAIKEKHLSGAITATAISPEILQELCFLPSNLKISKEAAKQIWDALWQNGIRRGKFDVASKSWSGTEISTADVPTVVSAFGVAAGKTPESIDAMTKQILGDEQVDAPVEYEEGEEPF